MFEAEKIKEVLKPLSHTHTHTVALWGTFLHLQLNFVVYVLGYACAVVASVNTNSGIGFRSILRQ